MSMYNDIVWRKKKELVLRILSSVPNMLENSRKDIGRVLGLDQEMVRNSHIRTEWRMGSCRGYYDD